MPATVKTEGFEKAEQDLAKLPIEIRGKTVQSGLRSAGRAVIKEARAICPVSDEEGSHLVNSLGVVVREGKTIYAVVGPNWQTGRHGHLVEGASQKHPDGVDVRHHSHGKPTGTILRKQPFLFLAAGYTQEEQLKAISGAIERALKRVTG